MFFFQEMQTRSFFGKSLTEKEHFSIQSVEKTKVGRPRPQTALCGPPRVSAAKPCASLVLGYALHGFQPFLALVGLRPPLVAGFGLQ